MDRNPYVDRDTMLTQLLEPFPEEILDEKNGLTYVPAEYVRERLITATNNNYDWRIVSTEFRTDGAAQVRGEAIPVCICIGELDIPGLGRRAGCGVQEIQERQGADAAYKGASSDALKRAAMEFGVGLHQLYIETGEAKRAAKQGRPRNLANQRVQKPEPQPERDIAPPPPLPRATTDRTPFDPEKEKEAKLKRIFAIASKLGVDDATLKETMRLKYRKNTPADKFSRKDLGLDELIQFLDIMIAREAKGKK